MRPLRSTAGPARAVLVAALLATTTATAAAASTTSATEPSDPYEHIVHTYEPAAERPSVPALPVATESSAALPAWSLGLLPVLGAGAGALAGLRRRWADDA